MCLLGAARFLFRLGGLWDSAARRMRILGGVYMNHKVRALVQVEKYGLFGKKKVFEERTITVDGETYRKMKKAEKDRPFSIGEMMFYDFLWDDD